MNLKITTEHCHIVHECATMQTINAFFHSERADLNSQRLSQLESESNLEMKRTEAERLNLCGIFSKRLVLVKQVLNGLQWKSVIGTQQPPCGEWEKITQAGPKSLWGWIRDGTEMTAKLFLMGWWLESLRRSRSIPVQSTKLTCDFKHIKCNGLTFMDPGYTTVVQEA